MTYRVPAADWSRRVQDLAAGLTVPSDLPPLIVEWRSGEMSIRDGNHRHAAMQMAGWPSGWAVIWCNDEVDWQAAGLALAKLSDSAVPWSD